MAKAFDVHERSSSFVYSLRAVWTLRLALGLAVLLGTALFFLGTCWDIQWHAFIGRDRTLIPPHVMMLCGVALSGMAALAAVIVETMWARRNSTLVDHSTGFAGMFQSPLGAYIAGFGALDAAVAFPLDSTGMLYMVLMLRSGLLFTSCLLSGWLLLPWGVFICSCRLRTWQRMSWCMDSAVQDIVGRYSPLR